MSDFFAKRQGQVPAFFIGLILYGLVALIFTRQALQLHTSVAVRDAKLPRLRAPAEKYVRVLLDSTREDGMGWSFGRGIGAYGQMHPLSILLQALRDKWVPAEKEAQARDLVRRLFSCFFSTYVDVEHGVLVIRDSERDTIAGHTTRMANFDAARYLCQWSRLARTVGGNLPTGLPLLPLRPRAQGTGPLRLQRPGLRPVRATAARLRRRSGPARLARLPPYARGDGLARQRPGLALHPVADHRWPARHALVLRAERAGRDGEPGRLPFPLRATRAD